MLLRKVRLENYGLYRGAVEFDLIPRTKYGSIRPIILLGGKNGAGKTTLLDALRLCFYGKLAIGSKVSQKEYYQFLHARVHRKRKKAEEGFASISVEFDYVRRGVPNTIQVQRSWEIDNGTVSKENLEITENGKELEEVTPDFWDGFISEIVPERLSQLFFFDGEKIMTIADDETSNIALAESIRNLLGLDLVDRLRNDLATYLRKELRDTGTREEIQALEQVEKDIETTEELIESKRQLRSELVTQRAGIEADISSLRDRLRQEGYGYAIKREGLEEERESLLEKVSETQAMIRDEVSHAFPLSLCPNIRDYLFDRIEEDRTNHNVSLLCDAFKGLKTEVLSDLVIVLEGMDREYITKAKESVVHTIDSHTPNNTGYEALLELSQSEESEFARTLLNEAEGSKRAVNDLARQLEKLIRQLQKTEDLLSKAPKEEQIAHLVEALSKENNQMGSAEEGIRQKDQDIQSLSNELSGLHREKDRITSRQAENFRHLKRISLAQTARDSLELYQKRLTKRKTSQLRLEVAECFNQLARKDDLLNRIEIDPTSFSVRLFDSQDVEIPKEDLSAGEKQILATALLWGLAKTSGRPLPVIIDTPLGRLDSDHRRNLIQNYFPKASHQVILLSTDTEVDQVLFDDLRANISHCYHLEYDEKNKATAPVEGYFWVGQPHDK